MGRPRSDEPKKAQFNVRLTDEQYAALEALAFVERTSPAECLRALLDREVEKRRRSDYLYIQALRLRIEAELRKQGRVTPLSPPGEASS